jgi:hypothetical protein
MEKMTKSYDYVILMETSQLSLITPQLIVPLLLMIEFFKLTSGLNGFLLKFPGVLLVGNIGKN